MLTPPLSLPILYPKGECFHRFAGLPFGRALERLDRTGFVDVDHGVELVSQTSPKIVALALRSRAIYDANSTLEHLVAQAASQIFAGHDREHETLSSGFVKEPFAAAVEGRT